MSVAWCSQKRETRRSGKRGIRDLISRLRRNRFADDGICVIELPGNNRASLGDVDNAVVIELLSYRYLCRRLRISVIPPELLPARCAVRLPRAEEGRGRDRLVLPAGSSPRQIQACGTRASAHVINLDRVEAGFQPDARRNLRRLRISVSKIGVQKRCRVKPNQCTAIRGKGKRVLSVSWHLDVARKHEAEVFIARTHRERQPIAHALR